MATKPEAAEADAAKPPAKVKSKKMLIIVGSVVLLLLLVGGGAFWFISKQRAAAAAALAEDGGDAPAVQTAAHETEKTPPVYLPMDNMVVNLADAGGERVAQVGITLQVRDAHAVDAVKAYLPTIRSGVLMLLSQRTAEELLSAEGKQKLIEDILLESSKPFDGGAEKPAPVAGKKVRKKAAVEYPVLGVLFSSLIVQ
ncbi:MAG TPA: flagellar basal body-associated FliL family protein [Rhodoferax sp.]